MLLIINIDLHYYLGGSSMSNQAAVQRLNNTNDLAIFLKTYPENTRKEYQRDIKEFTDYIGLHDITTLKNGEIEILDKDVRMYKNYLLEKFKPNTVRRNISTLRSFFKYLKTNKYNVNYEIFTTERIKANPNSYGLITLEQMKQMAILAKEELHHADELEICILVLAQTSRRISSVLNIDYNDIYTSEDEYLIKMMDKGEEIYQVPIDSILFNKILSIKKSNGKVFRNLNPAKVRRAIQKFAKLMNLPKNIRYTTHSFRQTAIHYELKTSGNIVAAMEQTGHRSAQTFIDHYTHMTVDHNSRAGIRMMRDVSEKNIEQLSKEELIKLLKEKAPSAYQEILINI
ncbi:hypothetical protein EBB07_29435 [Paenibacillaceae bacterium]|nr:hypothetical protein EBB07_29435 [Paenibacillaceae bacterium]